MYRKKMESIQSRTVYHKTNNSQTFAREEYEEKEEVRNNLTSPSFTIVNFF